MAGKIKKHKKGARRWAFPLGLLIAVLALVGAVTVLVAGVGAAKNAVQKSRNFDEYNKMLTPVVMNDPDAFDDITNANPEQLIDIAIWSILKSDLAPDQYEYGESGMIIPEADVTASFEKLFGTEIRPTHGTVEGYGYEFTYDANKQTYTIPLTGVVPTYTPRVVDLDKTNNSIVLTVAYLGGDQWAQDSEGNMVAPEPDKYMKVTLREKDGSYYISALQNTATPETATTAATETTTAAPTTTTAAPVSETETQTSAEAAA
ncbi:MAG: hypothetical protein ACI4K9_08670 [Candidatus Fimenecus sp.]